MLAKLREYVTAYRIAETCFLVAFFCYISYLIVGTTMFSISFDEYFEDNLFSTISVLAVAKAAILLFANVSDRKRNAILCACAAGVGLVFWKVFCVDEYSFLRFLAVLPLGMVGTDYHKVLRIYAWVTICAVGAAVLAALSGIITNLVYLNDGYLRSAFGIMFPTDYASYFVFALIAAWIGWKNISDAPFVVLGLISFANAFIIARSRTSAICSALFVILALCHWYAQTHPGLVEHHKRFADIWSWLVSLAFPLFCAFSLGVVFLYAKGIGLAGRLDGFFSGRFRLAFDAYKLHGLSLFGTPFEQIGAGATTFSQANYNYVDNTYWLILLRYGAVLLASLCVLWVLMARKGVALGDWRLVLGLALIAFHSVSEQHFIEVHYNVLLVLPFSVLGACSSVVGSERREEEDAEQKIAGLSRTTLISAALFIGIVLCVVLLAVPPALSFLRTAWDASGNTALDERMPYICAAFAELVCMVLMGLIALYGALCSLVARARAQRRCIAIVACNAAIMMIGLLLCNYVIDRHADEYSSSIASDEKAILAVQGANARTGGRLYSSELPVLFERAYGVFTASFFAGDDLARFENTTVLMSSDYESQCFLGKGFLYAQISDEHSLYSNDPAAIEALESAGYHLTGYYSTKRFVDFADAAAHNGLERAKDGALLLEGEEHSLRFGEGYNLRAGLHTINYELSISPDDYNAKTDKDYELGYLRISTDWGQNILKEVPVTYGMFDESGSCITEIPCSMGDSQGVEFLAFMNAGCSMSIRSISFQKTPECDTRVTYNDENRKVREMYYDEEGNPYKNSNGCYGCAYEYDASGNVNQITYLDAHGGPVLVYDGYAIVKRTYDAFKRVVREEYYDTREHQIVLSDGYASVEYGYDAAGNQAEICYMDPNGAPTLRAGGYAAVRKTFDGQNSVREDYFGVDGQPCNRTAGFASVTHEYDENGHDVCQRYYDTSGNLANTTSGCAEIRRVFDEDGRIVHELYVQATGEPAILEAGQSAVAYKYDAQGNRSDVYYLDADDNPVLVWDAYAHTHSEFNEKRQPTREIYYGLEDERIVTPQGYAALDMEYDERGDAVVLRYMGANEMPIMRTDGFHEIRRAYNDRHQIIRDEYYDTEGNPCECRGSYVAREYEYDAVGMQTRTILYARDGSEVTA